MPYDVVTMGEPLLRLTPPRYKLLDHADTLEVEVGGSEANTAVGLAGLGVRVAYWTRLTNNPLGKMIARTLTDYGVDLSHVTWTERDRVGLYYYEDAAAPRQPRVIYDRANSAASKARPSDIPEGLFGEGNARMLHLTGITPALSYAANGTALHALKLAEDANWRISFDVNFRSRLWPASDAQNGVEGGGGQVALGRAEERGIVEQGRQCHVGERGGVESGQGARRHQVGEATREFGDKG